MAERIYLLSAKAVKNLPRIQLPAAVAWRDGGDLLTASPLFKGFQRNGGLNGRGIYTEHGLVVFISQIRKGLCLLVPRVPNNYAKEEFFKFRWWRGGAVNYTEASFEERRSREDAKCWRWKSTSIRHSIFLEHEGPLLLMVYGSNLGWSAQVDPVNLKYRQHEIPKSKQEPWVELLTNYNHCLD